MSTVTIVVVSSLLAGLVLVALPWLASHEPLSVLGASIGPLNWDFSTSWGSNLTVVGAILGTVLSANILPGATVLASADGYTSLSLLFGVLVVLAPFVFTALRTGTATTHGPEYQGLGVGFLLACWVTLWGVTGELVTVGLVFYEAQHAHVLALGAVLPAWIALGAGLALTAYYALLTIWLTLASGSASAATNRAVGHDGLAAPEGADGRMSIAPSGWSLL